MKIDAMTEERRATLQAWLDIIRRLATTIDTPNLTEENVSAGMQQLVEVLAEDPVELPAPAPQKPPTLEELIATGMGDDEAARIFEEEKAKFDAGAPPYAPLPKPQRKARAKS